jgi:hypothetical protein
VVDADQGFVWVFHGSGATFASAVFTSRSAAEEWIRANQLRGTLTKYPLDVPVYDWAVDAGFFTPKRDDHRTPTFVGRFTSASQEHYHYTGDDSTHPDRDPADDGDADE